MLVMLSIITKTCVNVIYTVKVMSVRVFRSPFSPFFLLSLSLKLYFIYLTGLSYSIPIYVQRRSLLPFNAYRVIILQTRQTKVKKTYTTPYLLYRCCLGSWKDDGFVICWTWSSDARRVNDIRFYI